MTNAAEALACRPLPLVPAGFNPHAAIPYGLTIFHIQKAMEEFLDFLGFIDQQLLTRDIRRLETMLMPANFSSMVGEFIVASIPKYCATMVKNTFHNGHPDLLPAGSFPNDACRYGIDGIEVKGSRYLRGWQGHNPESCWLMVFVFDGNRPVDLAQKIPPKPFQFLLVAGAQLTKHDWKFSGRSEGSRRTITASVTPSGYAKMMTNWIYRSPSLNQSAAAELFDEEVEEEPGG